MIVILVFCAVKEYDMKIAASEWETSYSYRCVTRDRPDESDRIPHIARQELVVRCHIDKSVA